MKKLGKIFINMPWSAGAGAADTVGKGWKGGKIP